MKVVKYLLVLIVVVAAIFFGKGMLTDSITYEAEVLVNKSVEESWAVMSDDSKMKDWLKSIKKMELVSGEKNTVGAVSKIYIEENGQEMVMEETITAVTPNEHLAMTFTMDFMDMDYEMNMSEVDGKTKINTKSTVTGNGMFAKSMVAFMTSAMKKQEQDHLHDLQQVIEANTTDYFPVMEADSLVSDTLLEVIE